MEKPNHHSSLQYWIDWLLNLHAQEIDLGLERVRKVAELMNVLQPAPLIITVAGTNGKGSSVAMLVSILSEAGFQVGSYTSPHIQKFNERIQINQQAVTDFAIIHAFDQIETIRQQTKLTYFEFSTLAALSIFKNANLDVIVLEVGLGGRLDAVNVVDADVALITAIDIDHIDWLGDNRDQIAVEKAGVMRTGRFAVCSDTNPPATLKNYAQEHSVELLQLGVDFNFSPTSKIHHQILKGHSNWTWHNKTMRLVDASELTFVHPKLQGVFQLQNASGVIALLFELWSRKQLPYSLDFKALISAMNKGLRNCHHPGRLQEILVNHQYWLIDVAHNPQSAQMLADFIKLQKNQKFIAIFSVLKDKDSLPMVKELIPYVTRWLVADLNNPRAMTVKELQTLLGSAQVAVDSISGLESIESCVENAVMLKQPVLVFGSFFTVAQVFDALDKLQSEGKIQRLGVVSNSETV